MRTLLWFRGKDLRVRDHAALHAACATSGELLPVFVLEPRYFTPHAASPALGSARETSTSWAPHRMQFLLESLHELSLEIARRGSRLVVVQGPASRVIPRLVAELRIERVLAMRTIEPAACRRDARLAAVLQVPLIMFDHETLTVPGSVRTAAGGAFKVYTPFARAAEEQLGTLQLLPAPKRLPSMLPGAQNYEVAQLPSLQALGLVHNANLQTGGESAARDRLKHFFARPVRRYDTDRDRMDLPGTSRLSADLHFGTLSVRDVWQASIAAAAELQTSSDVAAMQGLRRYRAELLWREFAHSLLFERPDLISEPFRAAFRDFPWLDAPADFSAWCRGETGYPVVDAAARQLLQEGFVHNRARMIAASFLTKHLLVSYRHGEAHYRRYLTDGDIAQNNMGWQWCAGSGCDAQPYFRIFNPVTQGKRFDPEGRYVRRYLPELAALPTSHLHAPWLAPSAVLQAAAVNLGETYPQPIVDHALARQRYLLVAREHLGPASD